MTARTGRNPVQMPGWVPAVFLRVSAPVAIAQSVMHGGVTRFPGLLINLHYRKRCFGPGFMLGMGGLIPARKRRRPRPQPRACRREIGYRGVSKRGRHVVQHRGGLAGAGPSSRVNRPPCGRARIKRVLCVPVRLDFSGPSALQYSP